MLATSARQRQLPRLADQILAEGVVALLLHQMESGGLIDAPRGDENVVGPEAKRAVSLLAREGDASIDEMSADTESAGARLDIKEAQLGHRSGFAHQEYRAGDGSVALSHPRVLPGRVEVQ